MRPLALLAAMFLAGTAQAFATEVWHRLPTSQKPEHWLLAFEENAFIREKIGHWLMLRVYKSDGQPLEWRFKQLERKDDTTVFMLVIRTGDGSETEVGTSGFRDRGPDGQPPVVVSQEGDDVFAELTQGDGTKRRILFRRGTSIQDLRERVSVSKASVLWNWDTAPVYKLGRE